MVLQQLVEVGHVKISDYMIDVNNVVIKVSRLRYILLYLIYVVIECMQNCYSRQKAWLVKLSDNAFKSIKDNSFQRTETCMCLKQGQ